MDMNDMFDFSRRKFLKNSIVLAGTPLIIKNKSLDFASLDNPGLSAKLFWIEKGGGPATGLTWGMPWPKGKLKRGSDFYLTDAVGEKKALQSWPLAYWPDGSLKWTGHAAAAGLSVNSDYTVVAGKTVPHQEEVIIKESTDSILINTGKITCTINRKGKVLIENISINNKPIATEGRLILLIQDQPDDDDIEITNKHELQGSIDSITVEQNGPLRAIVKITGTHIGQGVTLLPYVIRLYFYANSDEIRLLHTLIYDADEKKQFIKGVGISFDVPLNDELHNRHIRFVNSAHNGMFAEAVRGLTGLRRDPDKQIKEAQLNGKATVPVNQFPPEIAGHLKYIPAFGDYTLFQGESTGFSIKKRTASGYSWLASGRGERALGTVYLGTPQGGLAAGIRNFWQSFPAQLDIRDAATATGRINLWLWAPNAQAMDLRFYHNGMGQDTYELQREGLDITYEDYEHGFGTPHGVARTSEIVLKALAATPTRDELLYIAHNIQEPATLICDHTYLEQQHVFGGNWTVEDRSVPPKAAIEQQLESYFEYYQKQTDFHNWYGYWNYGGFMHTYDQDRHSWRYDVGGFAWDNSELSSDLWIWYYY
ncbi:hypothetical protein [Mucilaginibacter sp. L196]|uniref:exo-rhamnogalacturonan lyase family protein n=1 Tax=Mucilaginibacter sp. L196 TaxID=1641870 RepID=UPI00131E2C98|nr:hypothetical protein [Mucilaginibacter sp. L196]